MKEYYVIYEIPNEYQSGRPVYIAETLEEAEEHIMEFANWYCPQGTCTIKKVNKHFMPIDEYEYDEGVRV
jgi:hypothetical protein